MQDTLALVRFASKVSEEESQGWESRQRTSVPGQCRVTLDRMGSQSFARTVDLEGFEVGTP